MVPARRRAEARTAFQRALSTLGPTAPIELTLDIRHGLALVQAELGRAAAAAWVTEVSRELYVLLPTELDRLWAEALEAEVAEACGRDREAERIRRHALERFRAADTPYDALLVALDLARAYAGEERPAEVERLRAEIAPLLGSPHVDPRTRVVVDLAFRVADRPDTIARIAAFVARSRHNTELPFPTAGAGMVVVGWNQLGQDLRIEVCRECGAAGETAALSAEEIEPAVRERVSWIYQELTGVEIRFAD